MKKLLFLLCVVVAGSMFYSCEKDNLEGPDAIFAGELRDRKTGELIQQEISDGSRVYFIEQGWGDNPPVQNMVVKKDGTFYNGMIFSGDYKIILNRGNYVPLDTLDMKIKPGKNYQVFEVNPYLRIIEPEISVIGRKVVAKFKLEQVTSNEVYRISLFAHSHIDVSNKLNIVNRTEELNRSILMVRLSNCLSIWKTTLPRWFRARVIISGSVHSLTEVRQSTIIRHLYSWIFSIKTEKP
mgnify:CR=1 FL=1